MTEREHRKTCGCLVGRVESMKAEPGGNRKN
jgi:hypothetical protein